jgi:hypothetical protein
MTKEQRKKDWLNWFKLTVRMAKNSRLAGNMESALRQDELIERYYKEASQYGFKEDTLFELESAIRA